MTTWLGEGGFTFVEVLTVALLLGVLVLAALPGYFGVEDEARRDVDRGNVRAINAALVLYAARSGGCPPDVDAFALLLNNATYFPDGAPVDPWTDPPSSKPYVATYSAALCRVQISVSAPSSIDHRTGVGH